MKRLRHLILIFCAAMSIPLAYFVLRTYQGLHQEEMAQLRYFAETLFDEMERELAVVVRKEENRAIDEYYYYYLPSGRSGEREVSPLSRASGESYILGYLQNNPDGSFQTPLVEKGKKAPPEVQPLVDRLMSVNNTFNHKRSSSDIFEIQPLSSLSKKKEQEAPSLADRYLKRSRSEEQKSYLGQAEKRVEKISADQALNLARQDKKAMRQIAKSSKDESGKREKTEKDFISEAEDQADWESRENEYSAALEAVQESLSFQAQEKLEAEIDPMQSVFINESEIFIFRRIVIDNQIFRQGFVIQNKDFLNYLAETHFNSQPMSRFTHLDLKIMNSGGEHVKVNAGAFADHPRFSLERTFPRPFSFLHAALTCQQIPRSAGRQTLNLMISGLAVIMLLGLFSIYRSARAVTDLAERRSRFVSSVSHELKTPLTNIRMYIEMLEQGIARTPEREQEYFRILGSENARLSRLINNILEFSKLEKKQLRLDMREGTFEEVIREVQQVMGENLFKAGFVLKVEKREIKPFLYDREVMIQILINLIENSMKFGKDCKLREINLCISPEEKKVNISVSDTGPGIPRQALKKVFDDFFRVETALIQNTRGTGIGLAFVKKLVNAMGGRVWAENNEGDGCTITISLPLQKTS